jgi:glycosyltransferase involved in cell wall biosynthesis
VNVKPKVTVLVSTYASEAFIAECLQNLENQTFASSLEIVVVDAASPQNERTIVEEFQKKHSNIRYIRPPTRITVYEAWNLAIREAKGEYLISASTNDQLAPNAIESLAGFLDEHPDVALVYGDSYLTETPHESFGRHTRTGAFQWLDYSYESLLQVCQIGPHPMWRKSVHSDVGYFDESYLACSDQDFWLRLGRKHRLAHVCAFTGLYWVSPDALSRKGTRPLIEAAEIRAKHQKEYVQHLKNEATRLVDGGDKLHAVEIAKKITAFSLQSAQLFHVLAEGYFDLGMFDQAIAAFKNSLSLEPTNLGLIQNFLRVCRSRELYPEALEFIKSLKVEDSYVEHLLGIGRIEVVNDRPLVSAILSTYNSANHIRGCLDSLVAQTLRNDLEILVIDSNSQQNEGDIVREYQKKHSNIRYLRTDKRETIYAAWNRGVKMSRGKYLTNANADDRLRNDALEILAHELDQREVGIVYSDTLITNQENETYNVNTAHSVWRQPDFNIQQMLMYCPFGPQPMWKRSAHEKIGVFEPQYTIAGDYEFFLRIAWKYGAYHVAQPLGLFLLHGTSLSHADQPRLMAEVRSFLTWYRTHIPIEQIYGIPAHLQTDAVKVKAMSHFATSLIMFPFNNFEESELLYRKVLRVGGFDGSVQNNLALILLQQNRRAEGLELLKAAAPHSLAAGRNWERLQKNSSEKCELVQMSLDTAGFDLPELLPTELSIIPCSQYFNLKAQPSKAVCAA